MGQIVCDTRVVRVELLGEPVVSWLKCYMARDIGGFPVFSGGTFLVLDTLSLSLYITVLCCTHQAPTDQAASPLS